MRSLQLMIFVLAFTGLTSVGAEFYEAPKDQRQNFAATFKIKPKVSSSKEGVTISFEVSAATDVEIAILDSKGNVIRHLSAGLLGKGAPAPLKADSLKQKLLWDRLDDLGKPVTGGPFKVRVRLCSSTSFVKNLGRDHRTSYDFVAGLAVNKTGDLYVLLTNGTYGRTELRAYKKNGDYLRTLIPMSAAVPQERFKGIGRIEVGGEKLPQIYNGHAFSTLPLIGGMTRQSICIGPEGNLTLFSALGTITNHGPPMHLLRMHPQGGAPEGLSFLGPEIVPRRGFFGGAGERGAMAYQSLALSPDGKTAYAGVNVERSSFKKYRKHCVWALKLTDKTVGQPFLGQAESGSDDAHFNDPQGIATDSKGNIYVCDRGNNRVMVFSADGKLLGKIKVDKPQQIAVHPGNGEIFIVSRIPGVGHKISGTTLLKFSAFADGQASEKSRLELRKKAIEVMAIDPSSSPTRIYAALCTGWRKFILVSLTEKGSSFDIGETFFSNKGLHYPVYTNVEPGGKHIFISDLKRAVYKVNPQDGKLRKSVRGHEVTPDKAGNLYYTKGWTLTMEKANAAGKKIAFGSKGTRGLGPWHMGNDDPIHKGKKATAKAKGVGTGPRGHCIGPDGNIYILLMTQYGNGRVDVYSPDGTEVKKGLVTNLPHGSSGIAVDASGNIYLGVNLKAKEGDKPLFPFGLDKVVPGKAWYHRKRRMKAQSTWDYSYYNTYLYHCGSVLKFPPSGGDMLYWGKFYAKRIPKPEIPAGYVEYRSGYFNMGYAVKGAQWRFLGLSPVPTGGLSWGDPSCSCNNSRFAVDGFGRAYLPDVFRFSINVIDTAGNHLERVGHYGNVDDKPVVIKGDGGPERAQPRFAWPSFVAVCGDDLYVTDTVNRQVSVLKIKYAVTEECPVK
jgi:NHL repeat